MPTNGISGNVCKLYIFAETSIRMNAVNNNRFAIPLFFIISDCNRVDISVERGTLDGEKDERKYYYMVKKIYSGRFATDGLGGFYYEKTIRSKYGIADMPSYKDVKAANEELSSQNSYFMNALDNLSGNEEEGER